MERKKERKDVQVEKSSEVQCAELALDQNQEWGIGGGALMSRCRWTAWNQVGPQSLSRERRKGKGKEGGGGGEEEGECRKKKR
jgi:hypothetical protein